MSYSLQPHGPLCPWMLQARMLGEMGSHFLLQGSFPDPGIEPTSPALQADSLPSESPGKLKVGSVLVGQSCLTLCVTRPVIHQVPLFMGFFRQEYWSGLPFPSQGDLPDPGVEPGSPTLQADPLPGSPTLQADPLRSERPGKLIG